MSFKDNTKREICIINYRTNFFFPFLWPQQQNTEVSNLQYKPRNEIDKQLVNDFAASFFHNGHLQRLQKLQHIFKVERLPKSTQGCEYFFIVSSVS